MPERAAEVTDKLRAIKEVEEKTLHQSITSKTNEKYYIADILPSGVYVSDLSLTNVGINSNPLDLVLGQARTGSSQNFVLSSVTNIEHAEIDNPIFAEFPNIQSAFAYYQDKSNYCTEINRMSNLCGRDYKYEVFSIVADPLTTYANFQEIWQVFKVVSAVLSIIALIIATTTYARLIEKDKKNHFALSLNGRNWLPNTTILYSASFSIKPHGGSFCSFDWSRTGGGIKFS